MERKKGIIYFCIDIAGAVLLFFIDRLSKIWACDTLRGKDAFVLVPGVFEFSYLENYGAAFGILQNFRIFFIVMGVAFLLIMMFFLLKLPPTKKYRLLRICFVFMAAGAAGNLYDRIFFNYVIDFIYFSYINFPVFNVADCYVTVSTAVLIILLLFVFREEDLDLKKINARNGSGNTKESVQEKKEDADGR
ncbi:MAG: signal peptidase II [Lachnospiraceae bacterium]|nr:signal peptidase II [Lachnospiraceae bacterium]